MPAGAPSKGLRRFADVLLPGKEDEGIGARAGTRRVELANGLDDALGQRQLRGILVFSHQRPVTNLHGIAAA